jgi:hypothetical protein
VKRREREGKGRAEKIEGENKHRGENKLEGTTSALPVISQRGRRILSGLQLTSHHTKE